MSTMLFYPFYDGLDCQDCSSNVNDEETYVPDEENELDPFQLLKSYKDLLKR